MINLQELDANEFFDIYRVFKPDATREEFEKDWADFQDFKANYEQKRGVQ